MSTKTTPKPLWSSIHDFNRWTISAILVSNVASVIWDGIGHLLESHLGYLVIEKFENLPGWTFVAAHFFFTSLHVPLNLFFESRSTWKNLVEVEAARRRVCRGPGGVGTWDVRRSRSINRAHLVAIGLALTVFVSPLRSYLGELAKGVLGTVLLFIEVVFRRDYEACYVVESELLALDKQKIRSDYETAVGLREELNILQRQYLWPAMAPLQEDEVMPFSEFLETSKGNVVKDVKLIE